MMDRHESPDPWQEEIGFIPHLPGGPEAINDDSFEEDVLDSPIPVLVEFWAARCGPCRRIAPELLAAAAMLGNKVRVFTVNVDEELPAAVRFQVTSIPAILLFIQGAEKARWIGAMDRLSLVNLVRPFLESMTKE